MASFRHLSSLSIIIINLSLAVADNSTCYFLDGSISVGAGFRCDNSTSTGHSACCAAGAVCYSNGICQQENNGIQDYLRVGCTDSTWSAPECLDQCTRFVPGSTAGIRFCGGSITSTNKYCCDNGTNGIGSFACCNTPSSIFEIEPIATVLAQVPLTYTKTTTSSTTQQTSTTQHTSTSATIEPISSTSISLLPSGVQASSSNGSSNHGVAIGVGIGVAVAALVVIAGVGFYYCGRKKRASRSREESVSMIEPKKLNTHELGNNEAANFQPRVSRSNHSRPASDSGHSQERMPREVQSPVELPAS